MPNAPKRSVAQSSDLMHIGVRLARRQISVCLCPNSKFRAIGSPLAVRGRMLGRSTFCLLITIAQVDPKRKPPPVDVRLKAATGRYRNVPRLGLKANQGESQRTLILGESSRSRSLDPGQITNRLRCVFFMTSSLISCLKACYGICVLP